MKKRVDECERTTVEVGERLFPGQVVRFDEAIDRGEPNVVPRVVVSLTRVA